jgi:asparagine synthase (glutamine-hydrolysing)
VPEPHTLYRGIRELPAGTALWIGRDGQKREYRFSSVAALIQQAEENSKAWSAAEVQERLRVAVLDSVQKHLIADVPIGVFLSSGIDSCTLAALATEVSTAPIHTLTLGFHEYRGQAEDETPLAEMMAQQLGSQHETRWVEQADFEQDYAGFIHAMDQPSMDGLNTWFVCKVAKQAGLTVAISGLGGDEFLGGYPAFQQVPAVVKRLKPLHGVSGTVGRAARVLSAGWLGKLTSSKYAGLLEYGTTYTGAYLLRRSVFMPWELEQHLPAEIIREGLPQVLEELHNALPAASLSDKGKISILESSLYMRNQLLRDSDWASMAHSIELRVPLVDIEVLAACARAGKNSLASTPQHTLPKILTSRAKTGFMTPIRQWLEQNHQIGHARGLRGWLTYLHKDAFFRV